jgi:hypothetical protein
MLKGIMDSTRVADVDAVYSQAVLEGLRDAGMNFISTVLTITRPFCEYPWQGSRVNDSFFSRFESLVAWCNEIGLGLQVDLFNEPSLRHGNPLNYPSADPGLVRRVPSGSWAVICREYIRRVVPIVNSLNFGAVLFVLEGTKSGPFEGWCYEWAKKCGLSNHLIIVSNSVKGALGVVHSPHVHSLEDIHRHGRPGAYLSDDGWYPLDEKKLGAAAKLARRKGCAAYETLLGGCLSGEQPLDLNGNPKGGHVPYQKRVRPKLDQLRRGIVARMIKAFGRV